MQPGCGRSQLSLTTCALPQLTGPPRAVVRSWDYHNRLTSLLRDGVVEARPCWRLSSFGDLELIESRVISDNATRKALILCFLVTPGVVVLMNRHVADSAMPRREGLASGDQI